MSRRKLDNMGVSAFCESMAMMIQSGIQTEEAVSLLHSGENRTGGILESALADMKKSLEEGSTLSRAMEDTGIFPEYALQMIKTGEDSGHLEDILFRLSTYYADQKVIQDKIRNAIIYPAAMLVLIIAVLSVMLAFVLPSFVKVYDSMLGSISSSAYNYINWAYGFCWLALILMIAVAVVLIVCLILWKTGKKDTVKAALSRIPATSKILESMGMFRFSGAFATFLSSGKLQDEAVLDSIPMADCRPVEEKLKKCARRMEEGHGFAQAAYEEEVFEPVYGRMLLAGERSGNLDKVLEKLNSHLEEDCSSRVDRLVGTVDPVLSFVLMVTVGLSLLSVMLPLIGMMSSIG
ncbi:MAG: type II secretion system F family protein [Clostridia bacterium]|nr:type II secretion system F family protein [Clostridia bacterium]